jgi:uncharacterized protein (DUF2236 family)
MGRLTRTAEYVAVVTYGTTADARRAGARVRAMHARLSGVEPESGRPFHVSDPALLRWVHAAEVASFLSAYRRCGGRLSAADADAYVAEQVRAAELVGLDPLTVPDSAGALEAYFAELRPELRATGEARRALRFLLFHTLEGPARPAWAALGSVAFGLLPRWARAAYGLPWSLSATPATELAAITAGRSLRTALAMVPDGLRASPARKAAFARLGLAA